MLEEITHERNGRKIKSIIDLRRFGVVIVDMQTKFLEIIADQEKKTLLRSQEDVLAACAIKDYPVIVLEYSWWGSTDDRLKALIEDIPRSDTIQKHLWDGFSNPKLRKRLNQWEIDYVCLMGINAEFCVKRTAESAICYGKKNFNCSTTDCQFRI